MKKNSFQWTFIPWVTFPLTFLICGIHIFAWLTGSSAKFEKSYGVVSGVYHTYITYAFLHDDWSHLAANTTLLIIFGSFLEQQVRRFYYELVSEVVPKALTPFVQNDIRCQQRL